MQYPESGKFFLIVFILCLPAAALAQQSTYAGNLDRDIKALSPMEIDGFLNGRGMGFAQAAELNHYPGPKHVLELSEQLLLTPEQIEETEAIFNSMKQDAIRLGARLVAKEKKLDRLFADSEIDHSLLESVVVEIGMVRAKLRMAHLKAHLEQIKVLSPNQVKAYDQLRGYQTGIDEPRKHRH